MKIKGTKGDDGLVGTAGDDVISGGKGDDVLRGKEGLDILKGGKGADLFVLPTGTTIDVIKDFQPGKDRIMIDTPLFTGGPGVPDGEVLIEDGLISYESEPIGLISPHVTLPEIDYWIS